MKFAVQIRADEYAEYRAAALWAEESGLDAFAVPDHYLSGSSDREETPFLDALAVMAGLAAETTSIELVVLVSPITFRHPAVLAKNAATIQQIAGGRFTLGVGAGWMAREHQIFGLPFPDTPTRFEMLDEALGYLRAAFAGDPTEFAGTHYRLQPARITPAPPLRLVVGGTGRYRTPTLAGRFADEFNVYPAPPDEFVERIAQAKGAAAGAGRDPDRLSLSSSGVIIGGATTAEFRSSLDAAAPVFRTTAEEIETSLRERNAPVGTWDQIRSTLGAMEAAGIERFYVQSISGFDRSGLERQLEGIGAWAPQGGAETTRYR